MEINTSISSVRLIGSKQITLSPSIISTKRVEEGTEELQLEFWVCGGVVPCWGSDVG